MENKINSLAIGQAKVFETNSGVDERVLRLKNGGWDALKVKKGKGGGRPGKLKVKHIKFVYDAVTGGDPRQQSFSFALWTRDLVKKTYLEKV